MDDETAAKLAALNLAVSAQERMNDLFLENLLSVVLAASGPNLSSDLLETLYDTQSHLPIPDSDAPSPATTAQHVAQVYWKHKIDLTERAVKIADELRKRDP